MLSWWRISSLTFLQVCFWDVDVNIAEGFERNACRRKAILWHHWSTKFDRNLTEPQQPILEVKQSVNLLDSSPASSFLVRSSTSSTSPNFPNRSLRSFWVTEGPNPPIYSRCIAPYPQQHCHGTDNRHKDQPSVDPSLSSLWMGTQEPLGFTAHTF